MNTATVHRAGLLVLLLVGCGGSGGTIKAFAASPQRACPDQPVSLTWDATGTTSMTMRAVSDPTAPDASVVRFELTSTSGGTVTTAKQDVVIIHVDDVRPLAFRARRDPDGGVAAGESVPADRWDADIRIGTVQADWSGSIDPKAPRAITVVHEGRTIVLDAGGAWSDALRGTRVSGPWELSAPLTVDERSGASAPPKQLHVNVKLQCVPGGT